MLSKNEKKIYRSLSTRKGRREHGLFMAQGTKCVLDTIEHFRMHRLLSTASWAGDHLECLAQIVSEQDLEAITTLSTAPNVIAIYELPDEAPVQAPSKGLSLALDCVQDPGNLGTIMRVCDWMGVHEIFASRDTADLWSPKVVQATMGAISRVCVHYCDLPDLLSECHLPIVGTFLDGENIYKARLPKDAIIVMGNEGNGISDEIATLVSQRLLIPSYPPNVENSESLNVAIATAITLSEFRRNG